MKKLNIGIASFAHMHAYSYYNNLKWMENVEIIALAEESNLCKPEVKKLGEKFYDTYDALIKDDNIDTIIITTETSKHKDVAISAFESGKDVIVEKPIALTLDEADAMINAAAQNGRKLVQCYPCRYHPTASAIKQKIDNGDLGELLHISATNHGQMPAHEGATKWFSQKELSGGGALMDHITHVADLNFWFSNQELQSVFAVKDNFFHPNVDIDDAGMVHLVYDKGLKGVIDPSWSRPQRFDTWGDVTMTIYGTEGTLMYDMFAQSSRAYSNNQDHSMLINFGTDMDYLMMKDFVENLLNDKCPMLTGVDGRKALEVALMAYESTEKNQVITK